MLGSIDEVRAALAKGSTPGDVFRTARSRAAELDGGDRPLNAFISLHDEPAEVEAGLGSLAGVPVAVKDNICTADLPTTCGSRMLDSYRSPYTATAVRRLVEVGAMVLGKTNMDEFAMGSSNENSAFGAVRNPVDPGRVPGGSSGGSAAAVAAGVVPIALGSSTGGSVRQPAALCGIVGLKPTYGRVSRYGLVAFASSLDQVGVLSRNVRDAATTLESISGPDEFDATVIDRPAPRADAVDGVDLTGRVIGLPEEYFGPGIDEGVRELCEQAIDGMRDAGATIRSISLPTSAQAIPCYYVLAPAEASSNLARFDGVRYGFRASDAADLFSMYADTRGEGFGAEVKRRIMIGTYVLSAGYYEAYYVRAQRVRHAVADDFQDAFSSGIDAIFAPTTPATAFCLGEKTADPFEMYLSDVFTVSANLAGLPAVSVPIGNADGLPVGGQFMAARWNEELMLGLAARLEELVDYRHPLSAGPDV
jgi:aspartyl-tRNA(Asn)/glutamyl-tRNA(Gln) amidotransferase subunit A